MSVNVFDGIDKVLKTFLKMHVNVIDACPAEINGEKGLLGVSQALCFRVWFDTETDSKTFFTSFRKLEAIEKFESLRNEYQVKKIK